MKFKGTLTLTVVGGCIKLQNRLCEIRRHRRGLIVDSTLICLAPLR